MGEHHFITTELRNNKRINSYGFMGVHNAYMCHWSLVGKGLNVLPLQLVPRELSRGDLHGRKASWLRLRRRRRRRTRRELGLMVGTIDLSNPDSREGD